MSGGSYDYLFTKDADELLSHMQQLTEMSDRLARLGYAADAARETEDLLLTLRQFQNRVEARADRLRDIWHSVEWWDSGDSGEDGLLISLARYRGEPLPRCARCSAEIVRDSGHLYKATGYRHVDRRAADSAGCPAAAAAPAGTSS